VPPNLNSVGGASESFLRVFVFGRAQPRGVLGAERTPTPAPSSTFFVLRLLALAARLLLLKVLSLLLLAMVVDGAGSAHGANTTDELLLSMLPALLLFVSVDGRGNIRAGNPGGGPRWRSGRITREGIADRRGSDADGRGVTPRVPPGQHYRVRCIG
jgi:hypothetical protein